MAGVKKFRITIEQVKKEYHEMLLEGSNVMEVLDAAREMVKKKKRDKQKRFCLFGQKD